jgi:hypothetical protein
VLLHLLLLLPLLLLPLALLSALQVTLLSATASLPTTLALPATASPMLCHLQAADRLIEAYTRQLGGFWIMQLLLLLLLLLRRRLRQLSVAKRVGWVLALLCMQVFSPAAQALGAGCETAGCAVAVHILSTRVLV